MPIYEFACPKCRIIFSFLSKRVHPQRTPKCPKCANPYLHKQISGFALLRGSRQSEEDSGEAGEAAPDLDNPRVVQAMAEIEREMQHLDEQNPKHMAHIMKKMRDVMPPGSVPENLDVAIKRLEAGESPEQIEADMGDVLGETLGGSGGPAGGSAGGYTRDSTLHEY
jgi:putative FmdB family regulatory protein